jgi:hypothetical protein
MPSSLPCSGMPTSVIAGFFTICGSMLSAP